MHVTDVSDWLILGWRWQINMVMAELEAETDPDPRLMQINRECIEYLT